MPIEISHLMQTAMGQKDAIKVGDLPRQVAKHMGCHPAVVYLGGAELHKITLKHKDISAERLQMLFMAIRDGEYRTDDQNRARHLTVIWEFPETRETYVIGLKSASNGGEVWICTYYKISGRKLDKKLRKTTRIYQR
ncbi:hypothetical protein [Methyloligella solikamskensis]|uniref:Phage-Barnase-EndoU-ColicinE5/D-RelE like nuclease 3 domain-containing protein n=1 Tax=Methyloligella solikamskensis TaxID=1177756 RepID=A0ABW3J7C1_9HYPH